MKNNRQDGGFAKNREIFWTSGEIVNGSDNRGWQGYFLGGLAIPIFR